MTRERTIRWGFEPPGEYHLGVWVTKRTASVRLIKLWVCYRRKAHR